MVVEVLPLVYQRSCAATTALRQEDAGSGSREIKEGRGVDAENERADEADGDRKLHGYSEGDSFVGGRFR